MHIQWLNHDTAHVNRRDASNNNTVNTLPDCLTRHHMEDAEDSHMAGTRSSSIVITATEGRYQLSPVLEELTRRINANQEIRNVDCLDDALIRATEWALAKTNQYDMAS